MSRIDSRRISKLIAAIQVLENEAHAAGAHVAARALNRAKNAAGWESAGNTMMAVKAMERDHA